MLPDGGNELERLHIGIDCHLDALSRLPSFEELSDQPLGFNRKTEERLHPLDGAHRVADITQRPRLAAQDERLKNSFEESPPELFPDRILAVARRDEEWHDLVNRLEIGDVSVHRPATGPGIVRMKDPDK